MKTTRNRKVKRGKTRRTRRKTRTVHRGGGVKWWQPWKKDNEVVPEPTITLTQVQNYLREIFPTTFMCLTKELENRRKSTRSEIYLCDAPCDSKTQPVAAAQPSLSREILPIKPPNGWTKEKSNPNGWYTTVERDINGDITSIQNAGLKNISGGPGNINNLGNHNFDNYMINIDILPNPSYSYSTTIDDTLHTFSLKSNDGGSYLLWNDNVLYPMVRIIDTIIYNPENPLTITIEGKEYTLTKVE